MALRLGLPASWDVACSQTNLHEWRDAVRKHVCTSASATAAMARWDSQLSELASTAWTTSDHAVRTMDGERDESSENRAEWPMLTSGDEVLLTRHTNKTRALFEAELVAAADACGLPPPHLPRRVAPAVWALVQPCVAEAVSMKRASTLVMSCAASLVDANSPFATMRVAQQATTQADVQFRRWWVPRLAGVRSHLTVVAAATHAAGLVRAVAAVRLRVSSWSLTADSPFPAAAADTLPSLADATAPALAIRLSQVIDGAFEPNPEAAEARLVLVLARDGLLLLGHEVDPLTSAVPEMRCRADLNSVIRRWRARPFSFSAALDPWVAVAAINLTLRCAPPSPPHTNPGGGFTRQGRRICDIESSKEQQRGLLTDSTSKAEVHASVLCFFTSLMHTNNT